VNEIVEKADDFRSGSREFWQLSAGQNSVGLTTKGTSCAHSSSSFSGRFTRVLTGYFFIRAGYSLPVDADASGIPGNQKHALVTRRCPGCRRSMRGNIFFRHVKKCKGTSLEGKHAFLAVR
jgi:hypothetical protein